MKHIEIIVGTTLGATEYVAEHLHDKFEAEHIPSTVHIDAQIENLDHSANSLWLICSSTHGAGDLPDNIKSFYQGLVSKTHLTDKKFALIGLGCRDYDLFCQAGKNLQKILLDLGAKQIGSALFIDSIQDPVPEDRVDLWYEEWIKELK